MLHGWTQAQSKCKNLYFRAKVNKYSHTVVNKFVPTRWIFILSSLVPLLTESNSQAVNSGQIYKSQRAQWAWGPVMGSFTLGSLVLFQTQSRRSTTNGKMRRVADQGSRGQGEEEGGVTTLSKD